MENREKVEIIPGFFVGETVILHEETEETKKQELKLGTVGIVSKNDTGESLKGWKVVDYEKQFKEALDKKTPEEIQELFAKLVELGKIEPPTTGENNLTGE